MRLVAQKLCIYIFGVRYGGLVWRSKISASIGVFDGLSRMFQTYFPVLACQCERYFVVLKVDILLGGFSRLAKITGTWGPEASFMSMDGDAEVGNMLLMGSDG